jgi:hypothetical protein
LFGRERLEVSVFFLGRYGLALLLLLPLSVAFEHRVNVFLGRKAGLKRWNPLDLVKAELIAGGFWLGL